MWNQFSLSDNINCSLSSSRAAEFVSKHLGETQAAEGLLQLAQIVLALVGILPLNEISQWLSEFRKCHQRKAGFHIKSGRKLVGI